MGQTLAEIVGRNVKAYRTEKLKISQSELAERANVHRTYIGHIENGDINLTLSNLDRLAHALGIPAAKLLVDHKNTTK